MQPKDYQNFVLEKLKSYLCLLRQEHDSEQHQVAILQKEGFTEKKVKDYCQNTWNKLKESGQLPILRDQRGQIQNIPYIERTDNLGNMVPNICLKVPTGGGKTLLGAYAIEKIHSHYFLTSTGLVLWIVPTEAIYRQTIKNFKTRRHSYRKVLEMASGGRVKILEKTDAFSKQDLENYLCVMVLMLQSTNRETKESLRVFKDSGKFIDFFPRHDDHKANRLLLEAYQKQEGHGYALDVETYEVGTEGFQRTYIKQSLGNAIRIARPLVILDEGHKAYSPLARKTLFGWDDKKGLDQHKGLNPKFVLELSATPNMDDLQSNVLVNVSGLKLKEENMIKLPINVVVADKADWKKTLCLAYEKLKDLERDAQTFLSQSKNHIRPMMLIQVERTGKEQRHTKFIHSEDVREYLTRHLSLHPDAVRVKTSGKNELKDEDLLSPLSQVKSIITNKALQEGWDCPFAYILVILSKTQSKLALTQLIGRILRQPYARVTSLDSLNECYVFCYNREVGEVVSGIKQGLQREGMADVANHIRVQGDDLTLRKVTSQRRSPFKKTKIFLPKVLHKDGKSWRDIIYEADIIRHLNFSTLSYRQKDSIKLEDLRALKSKTIRLDIKDQGQWNVSLLPGEQRSGSIAMDFPYLVKRLSNVVPHPWQASRILEETIDSLRVQGLTDEDIYLNRYDLLEAIERDLMEQISERSEQLFRKKIAEGLICFKIFKDSIDLNWQMAHSVNFLVARGERMLRREDDSDLQLSLFEKTYVRHYNHLEKRIAWYLDENEAVKWWHRLIAKQDYHLQGWQKRKVYPDFLAFIQHKKSEIKKLSVLEVKGEHLKGNDDTNYKDKLFKLLEKYANNPISCGTLETASPSETKMVFKILMENSWRKDLQDTL